LSGMGRCSDKTWMSWDMRDPLCCLRKDGLPVKRLLVFVLMMCMVSLLSATVGCGKGSTTKAAGATTPAPTSAAK
jgi:hypothetical protein